MYTKEGTEDKESVTDDIFITKVEVHLKNIQVKRTTWKIAILWLNYFKLVPREKKMWIITPEDWFFWFSLRRTTLRRILPKEAWDCLVDLGSTYTGLGKNISALEMKMNGLKERP